MEDVVDLTNDEPNAQKPASPLRNYTELDNQQGDLGTLRLNASEF